MSIQNRLEHIISSEGLNKTTFSKALGLSNNVTIGRIIKEKRNPSYETIERIVKVFNINANWLILGDGDMSRNENEKRIISIEKSLNSLSQKIEKLQKDI